MTCYYHMETEWYSVLGKACYMCPLNITDCSRLPVYKCFVFFTSA